MNFEHNLQNAKINLIVEHPFFGSLLLKHPIDESSEVPTMAVTFDGHILYNRQWCEKKNQKELAFLLAHETMHVAFAHLARRGKRDPEVWNLANDAVINDMLIHANVGTFIEGGFVIDGAREKTSEQVYEELMKLRQQQKSGGGAGQGGGSGQSCGSGKNQPRGNSQNNVLPDLTYDKSQHTQEECQAAIADAKSEAAAAAAAAQMMGKLSADLARSLGVFIESKIPWYQKLECFMQSHAQQHQSWSRPNKRYLRTAYLPRRQRYPTMGPIIIGVDTSGSITPEDLAKYFGHLTAIIDQCHPESVTVLYTDAKVCDIDEFEPSDYPIAPRTKVRGGGGTDMRAVIRWAKEQEVDPSLCLIFTDGYTPFPKKEDVPFPLVWLCTTDSMKEVRNVPGEILFDEGSA